MKILFRTLGGKKIGFGHYFRCLSLAQALKDVGENIKVIFLINTELENLMDSTPFEYLIKDDFKTDIEVIKKEKPQIVILDTYLADDYYLQSIKKLTRLVLYDDNNDIYDCSVPNVVINGNVYASEVGYRGKETKYLLGPRYITLKPEYWQDNLSINNKTEILITTGGSDRYQVSYGILESLENIDIRKTLIIGPGFEEELIFKLRRSYPDTRFITKPPSLKQYIEEASIIISSGGTTIYEILSLGKLPVLFSLADNQDRACLYLADKGIGYIGKYPDIRYESIENHIYDANRKQRTNSQLKLLESVNPLGAKFIADEILTMLGKVL